MSKNNTKPGCSGTDPPTTEGMIEWFHEHIKQLCPQPGGQQAAANPQPENQQAANQQPQNLQPQNPQAAEYDDIKLGMKNTNTEPEYCDYENLLKMDPMDLFNKAANQQPQNPQAAHQQPKNPHIGLLPGCSKLAANQQDQNLQTLNQPTSNQSSSSRPSSSKPSTSNQHTSNWLTPDDRPSDEKSFDRIFNEQLAKVKKQLASVTRRLFE